MLEFVQTFGELPFSGDSTRDPNQPFSNGRREHAHKHAQKRAKHTIKQHKFTFNQRFNDGQRANEVGSHPDKETSCIGPSIATKLDGSQQHDSQTAP